MKTPKELLMSRHREAEPSLDIIRNEVLQSLKSQSIDAAQATSPQRGSVFTALWQELFVSCRRYWMGLGTAWCAIVFFIAVSGQSGMEGRVMAVAPSESLINAVREQQRLRAELLGVEIVQKVRAVRREDNLGPRSEMDTVFANV